MEELKEFQKRVYDNSVKHGWREEKPNMSRQIALIHSELRVYKHGGKLY